ncbi:Protein O-linked-mannose beta-1 [Mactra antiquata]
MTIISSLMHRKCLSKLCKSALLLMLILSVMINISFIIDTNRKLQLKQQTIDLHKVNGLSSRQPKHQEIIEKSQNSESRQNIAKIDIVSSKQLVSVKVNGKSIYLTENFDEDRGIHILVLNQANLNILARRVYDTYQGQEDEAMINFLNLLNPGRILIMAIKDEGTFSLKDESKAFLAKFGSEKSKLLHWRDMWAFVGIVGKGKLSEKLSVSPDVSSWGEPIVLSVNITLVPVAESHCKNWPDDAASRRRQIFCDNHEGYGNVCSCDNPQLLHYPKSPTLENGKSLDIPVAIIASNRAEYLFKTLTILLKTPGVAVDKITVFIDGFYDEPYDVARLLNLRAIQHTPSGTKNARITQHYKASLTATFELFPDAEYVIILEEDLQVSPDFFSYFDQTKSLLDKDETLYCVSAWNDQGYEHSCKDPSLLYRIETMPGLGWMMKKSLFLNDLYPQWPAADKQWDWDMWMRHAQIRKSRECIIPDISRTYHFGSKGLNINPYFQKLYFESHKLQSKPSVKLKDVDKLTSENYELLIKDLIKSAKVLDHSKDPCVDDFIPSTQNETYVMYIEMTSATDFDTWKYLAKCYKLWDLDVRGFHKSMWRQFMKDNHLIIVGVPASPYAIFKPEDVKPYLFEDPKKKPKE